MSYEVELEKVQSERAINETLWADFKAKVIDGTLEIEGATLEQHLEKIREIEKFTAGNRYIKDFHQFLKKLSVAYVFYYHSATKIWQRNEEIIEKLETMVNDLLPAYNLYNKLQEELGDTPAEQVIEAKNKQIEELSEMMVKLETLIEKQTNCLDDIMFEFQQAEMPAELQARFDRSLARWGIKVDLVQQIKVQQTAQQASEQKQEKPQLDITGTIGEGIMKEGEQRFRQNLMAYFGKAESKRGNKPNFFSVINGMCWAQKIPKELTEVLRNKARELDPIIYNEILTSMTNPSDKPKEGNPL